MSINEIKQNVEILETKSNEELVRYVNELLIQNKRHESKIVGLNAQLRYLNRHLKKVRDLIDNTMKINENVVNNKQGKVWK